MTYPFPGMNPWLENPLLWHDVYQRLSITLTEDLSPRLRPRYFVGVETHTYVSILDEKRKARYPDVTMVERGGRACCCCADDCPCAVYGSCAAR